MLGNMSGLYIIQGISIGDYAIAGAGSLVLKNMDDNTLHYGVPAEFVKHVKKGKKYLLKNDTPETVISTPNKPILDLVTEKSQWTKTLKEIGIFDFYHTYDYHQTSKNYDEKPILIVYRKDNVIIALPLLLRNIHNTFFKDATSVYGYAGPISKGVDSDFDNIFFIEELKRFLSKIKVISVFSRLNPFIPNQCEILRNLGKVNRQGSVVNIDLNLDLQTQRANYRSRLKTHINKARRLCTVRNAITNSDLQEFIDIYHENMNRVNAKKMYYFKKSYFEDLMANTKFKTELLLAIENQSGAIVAGSIFVVSNGIVQYHLSGTKSNFLHLTPTKLLIDEMRIIATNNNYNYFNLGGGLGGRDDDSLFDFKSSFSKDFKDFNLWKFISIPEIYNELISVKCPNLETDFFPKYRALDNLNE
ncbi:MAG: peptidoglycan bridge formation glycyltransferase FemA/FemB family protein [Aestuariibaculum sp.]